MATTKRKTSKKRVSKTTKQKASEAATNKAANAAIKEIETTANQAIAAIKGIQVPEKPKDGCNCRLEWVCDD